MFTGCARYFVEVYSAGVNAFPRQRCFLSEDMFGGTLQGEVDQMLLPWLLQLLLLHF